MAEGLSGGGTGDNLCCQIQTSMLVQTQLNSQHKHKETHWWVSGFIQEMLPLAAAWLPLNTVVAVWLPLCLQEPGSSRLGCLSVSC